MLAASLLLDGSPFWVLAAALAYLGAAFTGPRSAILLLLAAPVALAYAAPPQAFTSLITLAWVPITILAVVPLYLHMGARLPLKGAWGFFLLPVVLLLLFIFHPATASLLAADLAPRLQVLFMASATLIAIIASLLYSAVARPKDPVVHIHLEDSEKSDAPVPYR